MEGALVEDPRIPFLAPHLRTLVESGDDPGAAAEDDADAVSVLTAHRAKGLEFRLVFVAGLADGRFPMRARPEALALPERLGSSAGFDAGDDLAGETGRYANRATGSIRRSLMVARRSGRD